MAALPSSLSFSGRRRNVFGYCYDRHKICTVFVKEQLRCEDCKDHQLALAEDSKHPIYDIHLVAVGVFHQVIQNTYLLLTE